MKDRELEELIEQGKIPATPGNPRIPELAWYSYRTFQVYKLEKPPKGICRWCFKNPLPSLRHTYCSIECRFTTYMFCYPQGDESRSYLFCKQGGKCNICQESFYKIRVTRWGRDVTWISTHERGEIDHIMAISQGGIALGWENLQLLCPPCHRWKTAKERSKEWAQRSK